MFAAEIQLDTIPCFATSETKRIQDLCRINFIFGGNGSGKTSIGRKIAHHFKPQVLESNGAKKTLLYNKDYRETVIATSELEGQFALGEEAAGAEQEMRRLNVEKEGVTRDIENISESLGNNDSGTGKYGERQTLTRSKEAIVWNMQSHLPEAVKSRVMKGMNAKARMLQKVEGVITDGIPAPTAQEISSRMSDLTRSMNGDVVKQSRLSLPDLKKIDGASLESLLSEEYVPRASGQVGKLVEKLQNSDWLKSGLKYVNNDDDLLICPFCTEPLKSATLEEIEGIFNEEYENRLEEIQSQIEQIEINITTLSTWWASTSYSNLPASASAKLRDVEVDKQSITDDLQTIRRQLQDKLTNMSISMSPDCTLDLDTIGKSVAAFNDAVDSNNKLFSDRSALPGKAQREFLHFVNSETTEQRATVDENIGRLNSTITDMESRLAQKNARIVEINSRLTELATQGRTSALTLAFINRVVDTMCSGSFKLEPAGSSGRYRIVRADGSQAGESLSEGEAQLIAFLYFISEIENIDRPNGLSGVENCVAIIDDPMSSLDSEMLFAVSTLIKQVIERIESNDSRVDQLFCLSHNAVFYNELSYRRTKSSSGGGRIAHYLIRKSSFGNNRLLRSEDGVIKSTYDSLWADIAAAKNGNLHNVASVGNTMRRILESYFQLTNGLDLESLVFKCDADELVALNSLRSWLHSGSHNVLDDLFVAVTDDSVDVYLAVFEKVFVAAGHQGHYEMMMARCA